MDWSEHAWRLLAAAILAFGVLLVPWWLAIRRNSRRIRTLEDIQFGLRRDEHRYRVAFEASPTAQFLVDANGRIVLANPQASHVFGYGGPDLLGMPIKALIPGCLSDPTYLGRDTFVDERLVHGTAPVQELLGHRKDGGQVSVAVGLRSITTSEGAFIMASVVDITRRVALEHETAEQRDELAHLARVGMLGELSGSMAHELNQPLAAILSNAQAAQRFLDHSPANLDEVRASLEDIVADDKRAGDVIRQVRALLKKQAADYRPLEINELVLEVLRIVRSDLVNRHATTSTELAADLPLVLGDRIQLQQVFINLLLNAADAMISCSEPRELTIRSSVTEHGWVEVCVIDSGCGIPPKNLLRIFEPFVTTKREGVGLGLSVCRSIIAAHEGRLWAENNPQRGATVHVALPPLADIAY
ncbi:two-component system sensor histidine kinase NtrB [Agrilutibacter solisilvae]|uniref:histidine kinase n=1 Tax=Agrilutibacter solisilvae TaxID=2763317 RepID=A0A974Y038_9GAMM|nr:ATP-binding protein [Lysobacter solisilvae]QSX78793.1 PAS domain S-box protein [Lysobacter solisilvae]